MVYIPLYTKLRIYFLSVELIMDRFGDGTMQWWDDDEDSRHFKKKNVKCFVNL